MCDLLSGSYRPVHVYTPSHRPVHGKLNRLLFALVLPFTVSLILRCFRMSTRNTSISAMFFHATSAHRILP